jgi:hypothetical protein
VAFEATARELSRVAVDDFENGWSIWADGGKNYDNRMMRR